MKRITALIVLICIFIMALSACGNSVVSIGTYQNENDASQKIIITQNDIVFINVSFDELNEELRQDMGIDLRLTSFLSNPNSYLCKEGVLSIDIEFGISVSFQYGKNYIIVNGENFKLC